MPLDTSIPLNANAPAPANPLQTALQVAQYRYMNANGLAQQQAVNANRATSAAYQQATDPVTGQVDNNKLIGILSQNPDAAYNLPQVIQGINTQTQQRQTLQSGQVKLDSDQLALAKQRIGFLTQRFGAVDPNAPDFNQQIAGGALDFVKNFNGDPAQMMQGLADLPPASATPQQRAQWQQRHLGMLSDAATQLGAMTAKPTLVDNGGSQQYVDTNPVTNPNVVGQSFTKTLDPVTASSPVQVMGPGNTPGVVPRGEMWNVPPLPGGQSPAGAGAAVPMPGGPQPGGSAPAQSGPAHFVATAPAMGVQGSNDGNVQTVNTHWSQLSNDASNAQTNIGLAQNIKAYADKAATGKQGDKLAAANGLLSVFGVGGQTDLNTATDLLQKNMARLSLTSRQGAGGTDAAGALATAANPHGSMTMAAIKDAADQVIGSQQMALAEQKVLQPFKLNNNVAGYQQAQTQFNQAADPRVWQFQNMDPQQRQAFKAGMSPADQKAFSNKIRTLEGMGAIQ